MSSMIQSPPPRIQIGGGQGGPADPGAGAGGGTPGQPDNALVRQSLEAAIKNMDAAVAAEGDVQDKAAYAKVAAQIHGFLGAHQQLIDSLTGGGPANKIMRKSPPSGGAAPGGGY